MVHSNDKSFRDQLLSQEQKNPQLQQHFRREAQKMVTENLRWGQRITYVLISLLVGLLTLVFWAFAKLFEHLQMREGVPAVEPLRLSLMWAMILSAALAVFALWPALRGRVGRRLYPKAVRILFWLLALAIFSASFGALSFMEADFRSPVEIPVILTIFLFMLLAGVYLLLSGRIDRGDLDTRARMLELEYRIAELEKGRRDKPAPGNGSANSGS